MYCLCFRNVPHWHITHILTYIAGYEKQDFLLKLDFEFCPPVPEMSLWIYCVLYLKDIFRRILTTTFLLCTMNCWITAVKIQSLIYMKPCVLGKIPADAADCAHNPKKARCFSSNVSETIIFRRHAAIPPYSEKQFSDLDVGIKCRLCITTVKTHKDNY